MIIAKAKAAAVFLGPNGTGPWQDNEIQAFLQRSAKEGKPIIIPVILSSVQGEPKMPAFLQGITWVDFRKQNPDPVERLIWGITGKRNTNREIFVRINM
jgi:hypothetical protein